MKGFLKRRGLPLQAKVRAEANPTLKAGEPVLITKEHWETYSKELKDDFIPKPSARTRCIKEFWKSDGDTWVEISVFTGRVKRSTKAPVYRSLFLSVKLRIAYWDEPPTGASTVIWIQDDKRQECGKPSEDSRTTLMGHF